MESIFEASSEYLNFTIQKQYVQRNFFLLSLLLDDIWESRINRVWVDTYDKKWTNTLSHRKQCQQNVRKMDKTIMTYS